jgi:AraC family transcriptional activator of pobA
MRWKELQKCCSSLAEVATMVCNSIIDKVIELAKEKLSTIDLSMNEIAYALGFEHSQSFSKMFKSKASLSPLEFRQSFSGN